MGWIEGDTLNLAFLLCGKKTNLEEIVLFRENGDLFVFRCIHRNRDNITGNRQVAVLLDVVVVNTAGRHIAFGGQYFTGHSI